MCLPFSVLCPHWLIFTWWGCRDLCLWHKATKLAHSFLFCACIRFRLYGPSTCISFHKFSWQLSAFSLCSSSLNSASLVLSTTYLFIKVPLSPDMILCGWLGLKHQLQFYLLLCLFAFLWPSGVGYYTSSFWRGWGRGGGKGRVVVVVEKRHSEEEDFYRNIVWQLSFNSLSSLEFSGLLFFAIVVTNNQRCLCHYILLMVQSFKKVGPCDRKHPSDAMDDVIKHRDVDGGWAWVVLMGSVVNLMLLESLIAGVGILQVREWPSDWLISQLTYWPLRSPYNRLSD